MKKLLSLIALLFLVACDGAGTNLNMATGGATGTYYPLGGAMAAVISNRTDINITVMASGASADNLRQLSVGDAHIALAQNDVMYYAFTGTGIWTGNDPITNLATIMTLYPETIQIIVRADSGIYSVSDLAGMRVSVGSIGSGVEANALQVLAAYGLTTNDISVHNLGFGDSADAMQDNRIDAFFVTSATPNTSVESLYVNTNLRILGLSDGAINHLLNTYPFYDLYIVDSNSYSWVQEPVNTVAVQATLVTTTSLDEQIVYDILTALFEGQSEIGHARGQEFTLQSAIQAISVNLHPGAVRFFRERGVLD